MKSRDISAMPSASARVAKRIEAAGGALLIGAFCDKRESARNGAARRVANGKNASRRGCMPVQSSDGPADRPHRHGRVLCVGRAAPLSRAARPRRRHRRRPRPASRRQRADGSHEFASLRDYAGRGVVTTSTYEARKLGVFSAMGMMKSALLAPDAILLPVDFDEYRKYSRLFKAAVREIAPIVEDRGIDEIYVDLSERARRARRRRARDRQRHQGGGARAHRPHLLDRHHAQQAALEARLRARQARRPDAARPRRHAGAHLAARGAQGQRHRPEGRGQARRARHRDDRRHRRRRPGLPARPLRQELRRLAARGVARPRRSRRS